MAITSKLEVCNLALSYLGNYGSLGDIDTPVEPKELTFAAWYDITRQSLIKTVMPNFALQRNILAKVVETNRTGYKNVYPMPANCLKILGIGEVDQKENNFAVEANGSGVQRIYTNEDYPNGLPVRYVGDILDVNFWTPDFKLLMAYELACNTCMEITQDTQKLALLAQQRPLKMATLSGLSAQENMPIRKSVSNFRRGRWLGYDRSNTNATKR